MYGSNLHNTLYYLFSILFTFTQTHTHTYTLQNIKWSFDWVDLIYNSQIARQFKHKYKLQCIGQYKLKSVRHTVLLAENDQEDKKEEEEYTR